MHEVSLVAQLVDICAERAAGQPVDVVRVRHASTIPDPVLRQAFAMLTRGGSLATATLEAEPFDIRLRCACGFDGVLGHDDLVDTVAAVCPGCGDVSSRERTPEIDLLVRRSTTRACKRSQENGPFGPPERAVRQPTIRGTVDVGGDARRPPQTPHACAG